MGDYHRGGVSGLVRGCFGAPFTVEEGLGALSRHEHPTKTLFYLGSFVNGKVPGFGLVRLVTDSGRLFVPCVSW